MTADGFDMTGKWKIADIIKPLAGLVAMVENKNRVVFDEDENGVNISPICNKKTQKYIPINRVGRSYQFDWWIPVGEQSQGALNTVEADKKSQTTIKNRFSAFDPGFTRQV